MIVQPDFPEHWKTRQLVEITGDESAPMAVLRLWAHCQHSRRSEFPNMTPTQLASICHWGSRKPACHIALTKAGFVDKLKTRGYAAHQWNEHNAQLLQKWQAGLKGGRPPGDNSDQKPKFSENFPNDTSQRDQRSLGKHRDVEKPTDNRPQTGTNPDQIRSDQTRPEEIDQRDPILPDQTGYPSPPPAPIGNSMPDGSDSSKALGDGKGLVDGLVSGIASKLRSKVGVPTREAVYDFLTEAFPGAEQYTDAFLKAMNKQGWKDKNRHPITDWRAMAQAYASQAHRNK